MCFYINDLDVDDLANVWKYADDTPASEVVAKGDRSCAQEMTDKFAEWSTQNRVKLNCDKYKELRISFVKDKPQFAPIVVNGYELESVTSAKLLGLIISSNLTWNEHLEISDVIKKASNRLYFLVPLKRSRVPWQDMSTLYTACIRSRRWKLLEFGQNAWLFEILTGVITGRTLIFTVPDF